MCHVIWVTVECCGIFCWNVGTGRWACGCFMICRCIRNSSCTDYANTYLPCARMMIRLIRKLSLILCLILCLELFRGRGFSKSISSASWISTAVNMRGVLVVQLSVTEQSSCLYWNLSGDSACPYTGRPIVIVVVCNPESIHELHENERTLRARWLSGTSFSSQPVTGLAQHRLRGQYTILIS